MFPINRVVALLTPVFSAVAAVGSAWLLKHFPGLPVPSTAELVGIEVAAATSAAGAALKWLHGHQAWENRLAVYGHDLQDVQTDVDKADPELLKKLEELVEAKVTGLLAEVKLSPATPVAAPSPAAPAPATAPQS